MLTNSNSVAYSRAGDKFHYRWAARRCLNLISFDTDLIYVTIEGSTEPTSGGEDVIDFAEYRTNKNGKKTVNYFQLKHSTIRDDKNFTLSDLKDAFVGFSQRFKTLQQSSSFEDFSFQIITNRVISPNFKKNISELASSGHTQKTFYETIQSYTGLSDIDLQNFCSKIVLWDKESNYDGQKFNIRRELAEISAIQDLPSAEIRLVDKVWQKIEPYQSRQITKNDILEVFDVTDINDFFPVPPHLETLTTGYVDRVQQREIINEICCQSNPIVIKAAGGVGKSTLSNQMSNLFEAINIHNVVIAYDCFGNGRYRQPSERRHSIKNMVVQVINELAVKDLCLQLIPTRNEPDDHWIKIFLNRLKDVCEKLSAIDKQALLIIVFDATDNAMMAAKEYGESCFANLLLRESTPDNCRLVFTTRPERLYLLDPPSNVKQLELEGFTTEETLANLKCFYNKVTSLQAEEFNRLTGCNPRVQANALTTYSQYQSFRDFLLSFSTNQTVESLIRDNLDRLKDRYPEEFRQNIDDICRSLANLPPFIPLNVIAKFAKVSESEVASFVADLGRPLWLTASAVQFRDEPTEKWFQDNYSGTAEQISTYVDTIRTISPVTAYLAEALPILLLKAERFDELVNLAISDEFLPNLSQYDNSLIKSARLQYAFKAALKQKKYFETAKIALVAGEEIASNERQLQLIKNNIDLAYRYLSEDRLKELAYRKVLTGKWQGSELIYTASILSYLPNNKGQALNYFRSSEHWLSRYFETRKKLKESDDYCVDRQLENEDIFELHSAIFNLLGYEKFIDSACRWSPINLRYSIYSQQISKLIEVSDFQTIEQVANYGQKEPTLILAISDELFKVGKFIDSTYIYSCLNSITDSTSKLEAPIEHNFLNRAYSCQIFLSFAETSIKTQCPFDKIRTLLDNYYFLPNIYFISEEPHHYDTVFDYLRFLAIQIYINGDTTQDFDKYLKLCESRQDDNFEKELKTATDLVKQLYPIFALRLKAIVSGLQQIDQTSLTTFKSSHFTSDYYGRNRLKSIVINRAKFETVLFSKSNALIENFYDSMLGQKSDIKYDDKFIFIKASYLHDELFKFAELMEKELIDSLETFNEEVTAESYSEDYLKLCRATLNFSSDDAQVFFDKALSNTLKFSDETIARWNALTDIAKRSTENKIADPEIAHRYIRCAEFVGNSVSREKHWDRDEAISTCFYLSPNTAFANFNRWKERNIGNNNKQISTLAESALDFGEIAPEILWPALSTFKSEYGFKSFFKNCIRKVDKKHKQQIMLDYYIQNLRQKGVTGSIWKDIESIAHKLALENNELSYVKLLSRTYDKASSENVVLVDNKNAENNSQAIQAKWEEIYGEFDLLTENGFNKAFLLSEEKRKGRTFDDFWKGCFSKVEIRNSYSFLNIIVNSELLDYYDLRQAFESIPEAWKKRSAIIARWDELVTKIASRFPLNFTRTLAYEPSFIKPFLRTEISLQAIKDGIEIGFSHNPNLEDAYSLFQFVSCNVHRLSVEEAKQLAEFAISRFEEVIPVEYADGLWKNSNQIPTNNTQALIQFIFANLASPFAEERWRSVHAIIQLYRLNCNSEINYIISLISTGVDDIYLPENYRFYNLHAKLYLLLALSRASINDVEIIIEHINFFFDLATNPGNGVLVQFYAKQIALNIENNKPGSYQRPQIADLENIFKSSFDLIHNSPYSYHTDSEWSKPFKTKNLPEFHFAYDMDEYWFKPLGRVFGLHSSEVQNIAKDILFNKWHYEVNEPWPQDARERVWRELNSYRNEYSMTGRHGSYPDIDTYSFYLSYHLLFAVASQLLVNLPIVQYEYDEKSSFLVWLDRHLLSYDRIKLLADFRDFQPLERRDWVFKKADDAWKNSLMDEDFIDNLIIRENNKFWINVTGKWQEAFNDRVEQFYYSTVIISKEYSQSFLNTLETCQDFNDPCDIRNFCQSVIDFDEDKLSFENNPFQAIELLTVNEQYLDLPKKDPFAGHIEFKTYSLSVLISELLAKFGTVLKLDEKTWLYNNDIFLKNYYWGEFATGDRDEYYPNGSIARLSLQILLLICNLMSVEIAIQVTINRSDCAKYDKSRKYEYEPVRKTFILSADGRLRSTKKCYRIR